jgi:hypothetical protein
MARRYTREELLLLRESPLAVKPDGLPPAEEWMGCVWFPLLCTDILMSLDLVLRGASLLIVAGP